jgi:hypothetical protein
LATAPFFITITGRVETPQPSCGSLRLISNWKMTKYIAIDMSNFKDLSESDKEQMLMHFDNYNVEVMEVTYDQLEAKGLLDPETLVLNGIYYESKRLRLQTSKLLLKVPSIELVMELLE